MNDSELIARSVSDGRWFEALFDRHYGRIHRFCAARAGTDAADDLASETFTTAFRRRADYDLSCPDAAPWLYGIALKLLLGFRRRERARRLLPARLVSGQFSVESPVSEMFDPRGAVSVALAGLSESDRDLIVLFAWAELTYEQMAVVFGVPVGTVRSRLSRTRRQLRVSLASEMSDLVVEGTGL